MKLYVVMVKEGVQFIPCRTLSDKGIIASSISDYAMTGLDEEYRRLNNLGSNVTRNDFKIVEFESYKTEYCLEDLTAAVKEAYEIALNTVCDDGGTCNMDRPALSYRYMNATANEVLKAIKDAGVDSYESCGYINISIPGGYCGSCRKARAEAFSASLQRRGFPCYVRYIID